MYVGDVIFEYQPEQITATEAVGTLEVRIMGERYVYSGDIRTPVVGGNPVPLFKIGREGALLYRWEVASVGSGVVIEGQITLK
jgi:hypothetical protein